MSRDKPGKPWRRTDPTKTVGVFTSAGGMVRCSNAIATLRKTNAAGADALEMLRDKVGRECPVHGRIDDPVIGILEDEIAFGCPLCSSPEVLRQWQNEEPIT